MRTRRRTRFAAIGFAVAVGLAACTTTIKVEGWTVTCNDAPEDACSDVASLALNNMARSRPDQPTGVIVVVGRLGCGPVPEWADGTVCYDAHVPLSPTEEVCLVIAGRPALGGYGQVGGDQVSGAFSTGREPDLVCAWRHFAATVVFRDETELVVAIEPAEGDFFRRTAGPEVQADPTNPAMLVVEWDGGSCTDQIDFAFVRTETGYAIGFKGRYATGNCAGVGLARTLRITTSEPIDPATIVVSGQE